MRTRDEVFEFIRERRGWVEVLAAPAIFIELTGDPNAALLLNQLLYWTERTRNADGWIYKARSEWYSELRMNRYRFDVARRRLRTLGLLEEAHHLVQSRRILHLRLRSGALRSALQIHMGSEDSVHSAEDAQATSGERSRCDAPCPTRQGERDDSAPAAHAEGGPRKGMPTVDHPQRRGSAVRTVELEPLERLMVGHSRTETTTETTAESAFWRGIEAEGEKGDTGEERVTHREVAAQGVKDARGGAARYYDVICEPGPEESTARRPSSVCPDVLYHILERAGFPSEQDAERLNALLADYPGMDHVREFEEFAEYWRGRTPVRPWLALRRWLQRSSASGQSSAPQEARPYVWKRDAIGRCFIVSTEHGAMASRPGLSARPPHTGP